MGFKKRNGEMETFRPMRTDEVGLQNAIDQPQISETNAKPRTTQFRESRPAGESRR